MPTRQYVVILLTMFAASIVLGQETANKYDVLKTGGSPYFTAKIENLTEKLQLNTDQQAEIKPIAEQEVGYLEEIRGNSALSKKDKLKKLKTIVNNSDTQMKSMLSPEQWQKLQTLRKKQKSELSQLVQQSKADQKQ